MLEQMSSSVPTKNRTKLTKSFAQSLSLSLFLSLLFCAVSRPWGEFKTEDALAGWDSAGRE